MHELQIFKVVHFLAHSVHLKVIIISVRPINYGPVNECAGTKKIKSNEVLNAVKDSDNLFY